MRIAFIILLIIHCLIHLIGFSKAFHLLEIKTVSTISRSLGILWLTATITLLIAILLYIFKYEFWWVFGFVALIFSQISICTEWTDTRYGTIVNVIILAAISLGFLNWNFENKYKQDVKENLETHSAAIEILKESDVKHLPEPIQRYIRFSGSIGKPKVKNFKACFKGAIRKNEESEWMPFTSEQYNFIAEPTRLFFMKAIMKTLPVAGYHQYMKGSAKMDIKLFSAFTVQYSDGDTMNEAETVTFFNDMCCMAPATLIDERINWIETKGDTVRAAFSNHGIYIQAQLIFSDNGELISFISNDRYDSNAGKKLPWATPLKNYININGRLLPSYAETIYTYPGKDLCYGKFDVISVEYNVKN